MNGKRVYSIDFKKVSLKEINKKKARETLIVYFSNKLQFEKNFFLAGQG